MMWSCRLCSRYFMTPSLWQRTMTTATINTNRLLMQNTTRPTTHGSKAAEGLLPLPRRTQQAVALSSNPVFALSSNPVFSVLNGLHTSTTKTSGLNFTQVCKQYSVNASIHRLLPGCSTENFNVLPACLASENGRTNSASDNLTLMVPASLQSSGTSFSSEHGERDGMTANTSFSSALREREDVTANANFSTAFKSYSSARGVSTADASNGSSTVNRKLSPVFGKSSAAPKCSSPVGQNVVTAFTLGKSETYRRFVFRRFSPHADRGCNTTVKNYSTSAKPSSLFSNGTDDGYKSPVKVDLDLESRLSERNIGSLRRSVSARALALDVDQLVKDYKCWKELDNVKVTLETERSSIAKTMAQLVKNKKKAEVTAQKEELISQGKRIKEQLRELMPSWWSAEERVMLQALRLPADLHSLTSDADKELGSCKGTVGPADGTSHVKVAEEQGLLRFSNAGPRAVYLRGELAELEQSLLSFTAATVSQRSFTQMAGSEIFRSVLVEGCGLDPSDTEQVLSLRSKGEDTVEAMNAFHLKGNSLLSFAAFFAKMQVKTESLPVKMFSVGRHYRPPTELHLPGLYGTIQSNRVTMFGACEAGQDCTEIHAEMVDIAWDVVKRVGLPARKVQVSAKRLELAESLRTEIQVWAPSVGQFVQVAHASVHDDFPSRRLMSGAGADHSPLLMVSGVAMDTAVVLGSMIEHSCSKGHIQLMPAPALIEDVHT